VHFCGSSQIFVDSTQESRRNWNVAVVAEESTDYCDDDDDSIGCAAATTINTKQQTGELELRKNAANKDYRAAGAKVTKKRRSLCFYGKLGRSQLPSYLEDGLRRGV
jgi:hypothetical protein